MAELRVQSRVRSKVKAQTAGGTVAGAVSLLVVSILSRNGVELSPEEGVAVGVIATAVLGFAAGYVRQG